MLQKHPTKFSSERSRFNKASDFPLISLRYNELGIPINFNKALSLSECRKLCFRYRKLDPRFFSQEEMIWFEEQRDEGSELYTACRFPDENIMKDCPFGSVTFGIHDDDPISISILELEWMK